MLRFKDRVDAAQQLLKKLHPLLGKKDVVVFALPRGGVVLGVEIAKALKAPLDLAIARKIGAPENEEYAIAAVAEDGDIVMTGEAKHVDKTWFETAKQREIAEAKRRRIVYLGNRARQDVMGKTALIVDDGIATGLTIHAILKEIAHRKPAKVVIAVPVAPTDVVQQLRFEVDDVIVLGDLESGAISASYESFAQVSDDAVTTMMAKV